VIRGLDGSRPQTIAPSALMFQALGYRGLTSISSPSSLLTILLSQTRTSSPIASALPHSEGIAYKPLSGELVMCLRVGRMGPIK
jgi:hypothetical protein